MDYEMIDTVSLQKTLAEINIQRDKLTFVAHKITCILNSRQCRNNAAALLSAIGDEERKQLQILLAESIISTEHVSVPR